MSDTLAGVIDAAERGEFPPADGSITALRETRDCAVISFTAHILVAADVPPEWVYERIGPWELSDAYTPPFLGALADKVGRRVNAIDMLALAPPLAGPPPLPLTPILLDHPRVRRAQRYRHDVMVWTTEGGILTLGRGLAGRWEIGLEVDEPYRGRGLGRALATSARHLVPDGRPVWAQIAPGNAWSVRAMLAAGYRPVGMEALLVDHAGEH